MDKDDAKEELNLNLIKIKDIKECDAIILAVAHDIFAKFTKAQWNRMLNNNGVVVDIKSLYGKDTFIGTNIKHWRL